MSIVIPTFNEARYLTICVNHRLIQTCTNFELIILDGGSQDGTKAYLADLERKVAETICHPIGYVDNEGVIVREPFRVYPQNRKLLVITFDRDMGSTRSYNEGLYRVSGEYCTYIPGDDLPHPRMIEEMVAAIEKTGADFVYSDINVVDDNGRIVRQMRFPDYDFETCFASWYHIGVSHLYRTEWHEKAGLMDEAYQGANDYDHYLRFAMAGARFYHLPRVLYSVRHHGNDRKTGQHTEQKYARLIEESKRCAKRAREWMENSDAGKAEKQEMP